MPRHLNENECECTEYVVKPHDDDNDDDGGSGCII
jgi:hypothetical protein